MSYDVKDNSLQNNKRVDWIDVCKFLAIAIMCMGHIGVPAQISDLLHIFHMPVFFMLSGICFNEEKYKSFKKFFASRCRSLLIPHFFWSVTMYCVWRIYCQFSMMGNSVSISDFIWMLLTKDATDVQFGGFGVIQWFFTSLFVAELLFYGVLKFSSKFKWKKEVLFGCCLLLAFGGFLISKVTSYNPLGAVAALMGVLFYAIGYIWRQSNNFEMKLEIKQYLCDFFSLFICIVTVLIVWLKNGSINMRTSTYNNFILFILGAVAGSYVLILVSRYLVKLFKNDRTLMFRYMLYIGQNTLCVLIFNRLVQFTVVKFLNFVLNYTIGAEIWATLYGKVCLGLIDLIVEMIAIVPFIWLVNKYLPFTLGKKLKN